MEPKPQQPRRRGSDRPWAGDRVRFLCAIPEQKIEAGEEGRIKLVYPGDDLEYWIVPDRDTSKCIKFFDQELWQLEVIKHVDG